MTPRSNLLRVLSRIHDHPWAITSQVLETIVEIVEHPDDIDIEAVAAKMGRPLENTGGSVEIRDGVAVLGVEGPIFRHANLFTHVSGATSVDMLAMDFRSALDNPNVKSILLNIDSPGGEVDGIQELADQIREGSQKKPVTAYVDGIAASGGYWLASAASRIVASETALLGSIGVVASMRDNRAAQERQGVKTYEIVSSKSPFKRPDPATDAGRSQILEMVDALADVFIGRVAAFRGVSTDTVESNFGQGKTLVASRAVAAGMADEIGSFEPLVARLAAESAPRAVSIAIQEETTMADNPTPPAAAPQPAAPPTTSLTISSGSAGGLTITSDGTSVGTPPPVTYVEGYVIRNGPQERRRIAAILDSPEAQGREAMARALALDTDLTPEAARKVLAAAPAASAPASPANALAERMARLDNPTVGVRGAEQEEDTEAAEAARILAFVPKHRKIA